MKIGFIVICIICITSIIYVIYEEKNFYMTKLYFKYFLNIYIIYDQYVIHQLYIYSDLEMVNRFS